MGQLVKPTVNEVGWVYGLISVLVFCVGGVANSVTLGYFFTRSKKRDIPNLLYSHITVVDLLLCLLLLPVGVSFLEQGTSWLSNHTVCNVWGMFWNIANHMSIFLILTFNMCRTKALLFPFAKNSIIAVKGGICLYILLMVIQVCLPYFFRSSYTLNTNFLICHWDYKGLFGKDSRIYWLIFGLFNILERVIPFLAVLLSCGISYVLLLGQKRAELEELDVHSPNIKINWWERLFCKKRAIKNLNKIRFKQPPDRLKVRATCTILLATVNYAILNFPNMIYMILAFSDVLNGDREESLLRFDANNYFVTFCMVMCAGLHSMTTPLIWLCRMKDLRNFYKNLLYRAAAPLRCLKRKQMTLLRGTQGTSLGMNATSTDGDVRINPGADMSVSIGTITERIGPSCTRSSVTERIPESATE